MADHLKSVALRAASLLAEGGDRGLALAAQLGLFREEADAMGGVESGSGDRIGIWEPVTQDGGNGVSYVRLPTSSTSGGERQRWADVAIIPPKSKKRRVVLLGESVARGFFFDPHYTPAKVLETILQRHTPEGAEVIDLAANDLVAAELLTLASRIGDLEPDAVVIFAGNNWAASALSLTAENTVGRQVAAAVLREEGIAGLRAFVEKDFADVIERNMGMLPLLAEMLDAPITVLVPEFNLGDWSNHSSSAAPWLTGDRNQQWWSRHNAAIAAFHAKNFDAAASAARDLTDLDGGTTHNGWEILGHALEEMGRPEEARSFLEKARDARLWDTFNLSPRCYASIQEKLRQVQGDRVTVVDLPQVFRQWTHCEIPDRRIFMDYCHLSAEGIRVAMAKTAQALLPSDAAAPSLEAILADPELRVDPDVEGMAHLAAAVHNAHWGQERELLEYHLTRAAALSQGTCDAMSAYLAMQGRRAPPFMTEAAAVLGKRELLSHFLLRYNSARLLDELLLDTMAESLAAAGTKLAVSLDEIRAAEWGVLPGQELDLLAMDRQPSRAERAWPSEERGFYRAYTPSSRFAIPIGHTHDALLTITWRRPPFSADDTTCTLQIDGNDLGEYRLQRTWSTVKVKIPRAHAKPKNGIRSLVFHFSVGRWNGDDAIASLATELEAGRIGDFSPAFADIRSLRASIE
ncbi:hypothetical protein LVJ94_05630 [Pendulispora rubella]|uniref:SGNH hydrolase-type esterase domain-containing protein n=1 Tax=Pendulispora rubella TaxID=2741070 RepID=A0ABZ2L716_9BACT